ncbi:MAG: radical SAM family heme chaperone HemW [Phycisphaerales bacterium]|nr:radical SAM family heme chaperone HemW [Phycisphaerales bacterium]
MADNTAFSLAKQRSIGTSRVVFQDLHDQVPTQLDVQCARSLYIHIPFCSHKCHYCDFYSIVDRQDRQQLFTDRLVRELRAQAPYADQRPLKSIFIGGGTPSLLAPKLWKTLLSELDNLFDLSDIYAGIGEFSVENNPESVSQELAEVYKAGGVNRISMGAQSFNPEHLKSLDRIHDPAKVPVAIDIFRQAGIQRVSLDLIFAVPDQTIEQWDTDLRTALALPIEHLSAYGLTYEPGTAMTARLSRGEFTQMPDDLEAEMYLHTIKTLRAHGFDRYEVSNHAKPGAACKHNMYYWTSQDWLAVGPSASGHFRGARWKNTPRLDDYLKGDDQGFAPICDYEAPDARRELMDLLMTSIRLAQGVDAEHSLAQADKLGASVQLKLAALMCQDQGWLVDVQAPRWQLTDEGFLFADRVAREFIGALIVD